MAGHALKHEEGARNLKVDCMCVGVYREVANDFTKILMDHFMVQPQKLVAWLKVYQVLTSRLLQ
jgi:hypothetical protein